MPKYQVFVKALEEATRYFAQTCAMCKALNLNPSLLLEYLMKMTDHELSPEAAGTYCTKRLHCFLDQRVKYQLLPHQVKWKAMQVITEKGIHQLVSIAGLSQKSLEQHLDTKGWSPERYKDWMKQFPSISCAVDRQAQRGW